MCMASWRQPATAATGSWRGTSQAVNGSTRPRRRSARCSVPTRTMYAKARCDSCVAHPCPHPRLTMCMCVWAAWLQDTRVMHLLPHLLQRPRRHCRHRPLALHSHPGAAGAARLHACSSAPGRCSPQCMPYVTGCDSRNCIGCGPVRAVCGAHRLADGACVCVCGCLLGCVFIMCGVVWVASVAAQHGPRSPSIPLTQFVFLSVYCSHRNWRAGQRTLSLNGA